MILIVVLVPRLILVRIVGAIAVEIEREAGVEASVGSIIGAIKETEVLDKEGLIGEKEAQGTIALEMDMDKDADLAPETEVQEGLEDKIKKFQKVKNYSLQTLMAM